jgi:hypothetical protein
MMNVSQLGQQGQVAQVDFLLDDVPRTALAVLEVLPHDEPERRLERRREGHVALDALLDRVLWLAQRGRDVLQREVLIDVTDRENLPEHAIEAEVPLLLLFLLHQLLE